MPASSLARLARKSCERNIHMLSDIGDAPYEIVKPLLKLMDPLQLHELEQNSPQLVGRDEEVWKMFIKRDIMRSDKMAISPDDPSEWYGIYKALVDAQEERLANADAALRNLRYNAETEKNKHAAKQVELSTVKPLPGSTTSNEMIRMTKNERRHLRDPVRGIFGPSEYRAKGSAMQPNESAMKPKSKLTKIRKAAAQMNKVFSTSANRVQPPVAQRQVVRAPASFIEQHRKTSPKRVAQNAQESTTVETRKRRVDEGRAIDNDDDDGFVRERKRIKIAAHQSAEKQTIKSLADIRKSIKADSTAHEPRSQTQVIKPQSRPVPKPSPPQITRKPSTQPPLASRLNQTLGPIRPVKKAPAGIFMNAKKRVS